MPLNNVNEIAQKILAAPRSIQKQMCEEIYSSDCFTDQLTGILTEGNAKQLILACKRQKTLRFFTAQTLLFCDSTTISDVVFEELKKFRPIRTRNTFLTAIAHCPISIYQLQYIVEQKICAEAFAALLKVHAIYACYTVCDLKKLVQGNQQFLPAIDFSGLVGEHGVSESKRTFLESCSKVKR